MGSRVLNSAIQPGSTNLEMDQSVGASDRTQDIGQIVSMLRMTPEQRLEKLAAFVEFIDRTAPHAKLLRRRAGAARQG
jgi:hypothetical protein